MAVAVICQRAACRHHGRGERDGDGAARKKRQIGGRTGDVLGGAEQVAETAILVLLAARSGNAVTTTETESVADPARAVDGPRGVIHAPDAPADLGDSAAFAALKASCLKMSLPSAAQRDGRGRRAASLGLDAFENASFSRTGFWAMDRAAPRPRPRRQAWRRLSRILEIARDQPSARRRALSIRSGARGAGLAEFAGRRRRARRSFRHHPRRACGALDRPTARCAVIDPLSLTRIDRLADGWRVDAVQPALSYSVFERSGYRFA